MLFTLTPPQATTLPIGYQAGYGNTTGDNLAAFGRQSLYSNTTGADNTALGDRALYSNTTGQLNTSVGMGSLFDNSTGSNNLAVGREALANNTTASNNTAVGYRAGYTNTTGQYNTFIGKTAGEVSTSDFNTYIGHDAGLLMTSGQKNTILGRYNGNQGGLDIRTSSNYIVLSDGDGNPNLIVDNNGRLISGTTSQLGQVTIENQSNNTGISVRQTSSSTNYSAINIINDYATGGQTGLQIRFGDTSNSEVGSIRSSVSSTSYNTSSDYRLKENVVELTGATTRLKQLEPKRFNFIADADTTVDGFLAHEVQAVVPEAIHGTKDEVDDDGNPVYQGIDQSKLVPLLVATIKELEARITALENA